MDPQKISELAKLLRNNGDKILSCESTLTLSGKLRYICCIYIYMIYISKLEPLEPFVIFTFPNEVLFHIHICIYTLI